MTTVKKDEFFNQGVDYILGGKYVDIVKAMDDIWSFQKVLATKKDITDEETTNFKKGIEVCEEKITHLEENIRYLKSIKQP